MNDINFFVENMIKNKDGNNKISLFYEMYDYSKISNFISKNFSNKITYFEFNELIVFIFYLTNLQISLYKIGD